MITPPCDSPGCKQPSVHRVEAQSYFPWEPDITWPRQVALCVSCFAAYERKVWGKA